MTACLTGRELATVLAALRCWQQRLDDSEGKAPIRNHFDDTVTPLTAGEIDGLCERLNDSSFPG
jgi:hypothetical protein